MLRGGRHGIVTRPPYALRVDADGYRAKNEREAIKVMIEF